MFRTLVEMMVLSGVYSKSVFFVGIFEVELNLMFSYLYTNVLFPVVIILLPLSAFILLGVLLPPVGQCCNNNDHYNDNSNFIYTEHFSSESFK